MHQHLFNFAVCKIFRYVDCNFFPCVFAAIAIRSIDTDGSNIRIHQAIIYIIGNNRIRFRNRRTGRFIDDGCSEHAAQHFGTNLLRAGAQLCFTQTVPLLHQVAGMDIAVVFPYDNVLRHIDQTTGQITGVCRTQCGISQAFTGAVAGDKVFQNGQAFTEVRLYRTVNDTTGRIRHQASHTGQLFDLVNTAAGAGICHHSNRVELIRRVGFFQQVCHIIRRFIPNIYNFLITFVIGHQAAAVHCLRPVNLLFRILDNLLLALWYMDIGHRNGNAGIAGIVVTHFLYDIQYVGGTQVPIELMSLGNQFAQFLFSDQLTQMPELFTGFFVFAFTEEAQFFRQFFIVNRITDRRFNQAHALIFRLIHNIFVGNQDPDLCLQIQIFMIVSHQGFMETAVTVAFAFGAGPFNRHVIGAQNHILRRHSYRLAILRSQNIVHGHHHQPGFCLRLNGQRQMNCHLVTVKVRVISRTYQRVQRDGTTFGQNRLKCLNTQTVQRRCTVQQHRMFFDNLFQYIPDFRSCPFHHAFCRTDIQIRIIILQPFHNERFEKFQRHFFRQAALMHLHFGAYHDYRTAGIVDAFTQQVLTETSLLAFQHIGQGFQRPVAGSHNGTAAAAVIDQGVYGFLQHTFFITYNDVRRMQFQ